MNLFEQIQAAKNNLESVVPVTPLMMNFNLSEEFGATILLKREDLQIVRSYKIRGAYNKISSLSTAEKSKRNCLRQCRKPCARRGLFLSFVTNKRPNIHAHHNAQTEG